MPWATYSSGPSVTNGRAEIERSFDLATTVARYEELFATHLAAVAPDGDRAEARV